MNRWLWLVVVTVVCAGDVAIAQSTPPGSVPNDQVVAQLGPYALAGALGWRFIALLDRALGVVERGLDLFGRMVTALEAWVLTGRELVIRVDHPIPPLEKP